MSSDDVHPIRFESTAAQLRAALDAPADLNGRAETGRAETGGPQTGGPPTSGGLTGSPGRTHSVAHAGSRELAAAGDRMGSGGRADSVAHAGAESGADLDNAAVPAGGMSADKAADLLGYLRDKAQAGRLERGAAVPAPAGAFTAAVEEALR